MPSLINRVTSFGRSPQGRSALQKAMNRFTGGGSTGHGGSTGRTTGRRGTGGRGRRTR